MSETAELESGVSLSMILFPSTLKYCPNFSVFSFIFNLRPAADLHSIACLPAQNNFLSQSSFFEGWVGVGGIFLSFSFGNVYRNCFSVCLLPSAWKLF